MCLSIPSKVIEINTDTNSVTIDTMGVSREASLDLMESGSIQVGDFVLIHIGFVMNKIDENDALASLETYREILAQMDSEELQKTIEQSDNCPNGA